MQTVNRRASSRLGQVRFVYDVVGAGAPIPGKHVAARQGTVRPLASRKPGGLKTNEKPVR